MRVTIERNGDVLTIRPAIDPAEEKRKLRDLIAMLRAIRRTGEVAERELIAFPGRPGLY